MKSEVRMTETTRRISRRGALKAGAAATTAAFAGKSARAAMPADIPSKKPNETRVVFLGGDQLHNFAAQEMTLRRICEGAGWTFYSLHDSRYLTPSLVASADLLMMQRWDGGVQGWVPGPVRTEAPENDGHMSEELAEAIIDNVTGRGMGFMSLHCTVATWRKPHFMKFMGVNGIIHGPLQPVRCHDFNQEHPITRGMGDFDLALDENFGCEPVDPAVTTLYETTGHMDKRHDYGGWCLERGNGRIVGLLAGHTYFAFRDPSYLKLYRRGAYWALRREVPEN